jgi:hypothetical protein
MRSREAAAVQRCPLPCTNQLVHPRASTAIEAGRAASLLPATPPSTARPPCCLRRCRSPRSLLHRFETCCCLRERPAPSLDLAFLARSSGGQPAARPAPQPPPPCPRPSHCTRALAMRAAAPAAPAAPACAPSPPTAAASPPARPSATRFHPQRFRPPAPPVPSPGSPAPLIAGNALASPARWPRRMLRPRGRAPPALHDTGRSPALQPPSMLR